MAINMFDKCILHITSCSQYGNNIYIKYKQKVNLKHHKQKTIKTSYNGLCILIFMISTCSIQISL